MQEPTGESEKEPDSKMFSTEIQKSFRKTLKCGIYKEYIKNYIDAPFYQMSN